MSKEYTPLRGRIYIHEKCGEGTRVPDSDFVGLCNPFEPCMGTMCASCGGPDDLKNFVWEETGEKLSDYRKRLRQDAPAFYSLWSWLISPSIGAAIGAAIGIFVVKDKPALDGGIGALIGATVMFLFIGPRILSVMAGDYFYSKK
jgi:hypothetical protein